MSRNWNQSLSNYETFPVAFSYLGKIQLCDILVSKWNGKMQPTSEFKSECDGLLNKIN